MQTRLTEDLGSLRLVDRATLDAVIAEFVEMLEQVGLSFPDGLEGALAMLDGRLHDDAARHLRARARGVADNDPWHVLNTAGEDDLLSLLQAESRSVGAVLLSKLAIEKAAALLARLPPQTAQELALAVSRIEGIRPEAVTIIGSALAQQLDNRPARAFAKPPTKRVGDILNFTAPDLRESLLAGLHDSDQGFAEGVRKAIFTFPDIPERIDPKQVSVLVKAISVDDLMTVIAADDAEDKPAVEFLLANISKRMAEPIREDAALLPAPARAQKDKAAASIMADIRELLDDGRLALRHSDEME
ncbi:MAG: flagellar motor switch protein FliG [Rhodobacteraceae bacterium]|nr:flagellar motor switch protein FliG [Paracoccaceae bacterium]